MKRWSKLFVSGLALSVVGTVGPAFGMSSGWGWAIWGVGTVMGWTGIVLGVRSLRKPDLFDEDR